MKTRTILATGTLLAAASGGGALAAAPAHAQGHATYVKASHSTTARKTVPSTFVAKRLPRGRALECTMKGDAARVTPSGTLKDGNYIVWVDRARLTKSGSVPLTVTVQRYQYNHGECPQVDAGTPVHTIVSASTTIGVLGGDNAGITALTGPAWLLPQVTNPSWNPGSRLSFTSPDGSKHYRVPKSVATTVLANGLAHLTVKHGKVATFQVLYQA